MDETKKHYFTDQEWTSLEAIADKGVRPIAPTLAADMLNLFMENYSCSEIAKINKGLSEIDVLYCRYKYNWDEQRDKYAKELQEQVVQKLMKMKLESMEFLTNMLSVLHKDERQKMMTYLQTGKEEDKPKSWVNGIGAYKSIIETLQKLTGEDKVQKHEVKAEHRIISSPEIKKAITKEVQSSLLKQLTSGKNKK